VHRQDIFVTTKVRIRHYGYDATLHAFEKSAAKIMPLRGHAATGTLA